jgi:hypothetical protein
VRSPGETRGQRRDWKLCHYNMLAQKLSHSRKESQQQPLPRRCPMIPSPLTRPCFLKVPPPPHCHTGDQGSSTGIHGVHAETVSKPGHPLKLYLSHGLLHSEYHAKEEDPDFVKTLLCRWPALSCFCPANPGLSQTSTVSFVLAQGGHLGVSLTTSCSRCP